MCLCKAINMTILITFRNSIILQSMIKPITAEAFSLNKPLR